jgi:hypothetical protein
MNWRWRPVAVVTSLAAIASCVQITVDGDEIGSIEFVPFTYPALFSGHPVFGRAKLDVRVFKADGSIATDVPASFFLLAGDTAYATISAENFLVAKAVTTNQTVQVVASAGGLQSTPKRIDIVPRPDTAIRDTPFDSGTVRFSLPAAAGDTSFALKVIVRGAAPASPPVRSFIVNYQILKGSRLLSTTDTTQAFFMVDDAGRVTDVDTTDGTGVVSRRLRFRIRQGQALQDTVTVRALVQRGDSVVRGAPINWQLKTLQR